MGQHRLDYELFCADALRGVVRRALMLVAEKGLPGGHHFLITFKTDHPGVTMPEYLRERYPDTISVMLQYEFWNLDVEEDSLQGIYRVAEAKLQRSSGQDAYDGE